jgi:hypothetical protein
MARRAIGSDGTKVERRKKQRFAVAVAIEVSWRGPDGILLTENATARQVNAKRRAAADAELSGGRE